MNLKKLLIPSLVLLLVVASSGTVGAQDLPSSSEKVQAGSATRMNVFLDEDGDGFNDLAPDRDGDGIPDRLDPDTQPAHKGQGPTTRWLHLAKLFSLIMNSSDMVGSGPGQFGAGGESGLGQGPGQRTGFGPDSGDATGDGVDLGGRSQRRGGQR